MKLGRKQIQSLRIQRFPWRYERLNMNGEEYVWLADRITVCYLRRRNGPSIAAQHARNAELLARWREANPS